MNVYAFRSINEYFLIVKSTASAHKSVGETSPACVEETMWSSQSSFKWRAAHFPMGEA